MRFVGLYEAVLRGRGQPGPALHAPVIVYAGVSTALPGFAGALAVHDQERGAPGTGMRTFGDAVR